MLADTGLHLGHFELTHILSRSQLAWLVKLGFAIKNTANSALHVTNIRPVRLIVIPVALLSADKAKVLYKFTVTDYYPMQFDTRYGLLATFVPHLSMARPASKRLTQVAKRGPVEIHSFSKWPPATLNQLHRDWIVKVGFKGASAPVPPGNVDNVFFNLDVIYTKSDGLAIQVTRRHHSRPKGGFPL